MTTCSFNNNHYQLEEQETVQFHNSLSITVDEFPGTTSTYSA